MRCRNRLWKPERTSKKFPAKERAGDIRIIDGKTGKIKETIAINQILFIQSRNEILENLDPLNARDTEKYREWKQAILRRDKKTCVLCRSKEWPQVHHVIRWIDDRGKRYDIQNGVVLCITCHYKHHGPHMQAFPKHITGELIKYLAGCNIREQYGKPD